MNRTKVAMALLALAGAGAYFLRPVAAASAKPEAAVNAPGLVNATGTHVVAAGRTEPASEEIDVTTELDGRIARMFVEEGGTVRRGQVIVELVNADYAARVAQARAAIDEREAALARARNGSRPMQRAESKAQIREAEAVLENARRERERREGLLASGAISRTEFDTVDREYQVARARLEAAQERSALVDDEVRPEEIQRAEAELARARAQFAEAVAVLEKTRIRAPIDGVVMRKFRNAGESVSPDGRQPIVTLGDLARMRVRTEVDENDIGLVRVGQPVYITASAYGEKRFTGRVARIGSILGRKKLTTDAPNERIDTKVLEAMVDLDGAAQLPAGLRVDVFIER